MGSHFGISHGGVSLKALGPNTHVDNLTMRATGADFPSLAKNTTNNV